MNLKPIIEHCEYLVSQDETELALKLLDLVPGYYRDNYPPQLEDLRNLILSKMTLPYDLLDDEREMPKSKEHSIAFMNGTARGLALKNAVIEANKKDLVPQITDVGPGDFTFAIGMISEGLQFCYYPITLNKQADKALSERMNLGLTINECNPHWFVAYEIIEHLEPREIAVAFHRRNQLVNFKKIFISTPKYTFGKGTTNWKSEGIHHLRTYTPREFIAKAMELFPGYSWNFIDNEVMVLIGDRNA